jgi:hypothetical protein
MVADSGNDELCVDNNFKIKPAGVEALRKANALHPGFCVCRAGRLKELVTISHLLLRGNNNRDK